MSKSYGVGSLMVSSLLAISVSISLGSENAPGIIKKKGVEIDLRSQGRIIGDEVATVGNLAKIEDITPIPGLPLIPQIHLRGGNTQTNSPALDNIQVFEGTRPFVKFTQSETSVAAFGQNIVATYNTSANQPVVQVGSGLFFVHRFLSGYSVSNDGGRTWTSGFMPPLPGSIFTFGDPAADVDRNGNFYFSGLGADALGRFTIQLNKSTNGGRSWSDAVLVQQDNGGDKAWLAVGPDPKIKSRDNVYVTWTSFQSTGAQLRFGRSIDGGATFTSKTIFAPAADPNPANPQNSLQFSNPSVDPITGTLYIPFVHFSNSDQDFVRVLISEDAGETFRSATFNVPGAPDPTLLPITQPGELIECGATRIAPPPPAVPFFVVNVRLAIRTGANVGGSLTGLPRYLQASRLVVQPAFVARNGTLYLAWSNSTSNVFGDPAAGSNILFVRSNDGGTTWTAPIRVNPAVSSDPHHVLPALDIDNDLNDVHVAYYTQHSNGTIDVDMANSHDRGSSFPLDRVVRVTSESQVLAPTNVPVPVATNPFATTNYDRLLQSCYSLGEYLSVKSANGRQYLLWGDLRNSMTEPVDVLNPLSGVTHSQQDVFFQQVRAQ